MNFVRNSSSRIIDFGIGGVEGDGTSNTIMIGETSPPSSIAGEYITDVFIGASTIQP